MIIKSMARKEPSFRQLMAYLNKGHDRAEGLTFGRNLYDEPAQGVMVVKAFERNYRFLPKRANGNALYHEVIVLERDTGLSDQRQAELLLKLAERYCATRAPHQLAYGRIHRDREHHHIHLMISSNAVRSDKRVRMSKSQFAEIQRGLERYKLERFPELGSLRIYNRDRALERTAPSSRKSSVRDILNDLFRRAATEKELVRSMQAAGLRFYVHGRQTGVEVIETGRRHRLKTLKLDEIYFKTFRRLQPDKTPTERLTEQSTQPRPMTDPRAEALLQRRRAMERIATDRLRQFEVERE